MVAEKFGENLGGDEQAIQALVDSLRREIFAAQKFCGGSIPNSQSLTSCIAAVYSALDGFRSESTNAVSVGGVDKGNNSVIASNRKLSYRIHINSIVQSMYTLFGRVLLPSPAKGVDSSQATIANSLGAILADSDTKGNPTAVRGYACRSEVVDSITSNSSKTLASADDQLPLKIQSLGLLSSVAMYDPGMHQKVMAAVHSFRHLHCFINGVLIICHERVPFPGTVKCF